MRRQSYALGIKEIVVSPNPDCVGEIMHTFGYPQIDKLMVVVLCTKRHQTKS